MTFLLTLDYELYGDGSGDVFKNVIEPTEQLLHLAEKYGVKYTFFFEVVEYWALKREWESGNHMGYAANPAEAMALQMQNAMRAGHDVQLHIHPQWCNATWEDDHWIVDLSQWRLSDYNGDMVELLRKGKETLEELFSPINQDYRCIALRAGGYNAQPSENIVKAMRSVGLKVDSSVVPGAVETGKLSKYDYHNSPQDMGWWYVDDKLESSSSRQSDIIELPVASLPMMRLNKYLSVSRLKALIQNRRSALKSYNAKTDNENASSLLSRVFSKIRYFFETEYQTWDFCLFSQRLHDKYLNTFNSIDRDVCILIGHPKSMADEGAICQFIANLSSSKSIRLDSNISLLYYSTLI